jgi:hypothetical protein
MKDDFEKSEPVSEDLTPPGESPESWHEHMLARWKRYPWFIATTDEHGQAEIAVKSGKIDRTTGTKPPLWRDEVTDKPFLVIVRKAQSPEEKMSVLMKRGESVKGKSYTVTVVDIREPRYVKDKIEEGK